jgi:hypothetical protein
LATLSSLVGGIYGLGIVRAWELFGANREFLYRVFNLVDTLRLKVSASKEETPQVAGAGGEASKRDRGRKTRPGSG